MIGGNVTDYEKGYEKGVEDVIALLKDIPANKEKYKSISMEYMGRTFTYHDFPFLIRKELNLLYWRQRD